MRNFETELKHKVDNLEDLSLIYTPGVGASCKQIEADSAFVNTLTNRKNSVAVIFDALKCPYSFIPHAEAVCAILKKVADIDAYPLLSTGYDINALVRNLEPSFGGFYVFSNTKVVDFSKVIVQENLDGYEFEAVVENARTMKQELESFKVESFSACSSDTLASHALNLRASLNGVIQVKNNFKLLSIKEMSEKFSKENLDKIAEQIRKTPQAVWELTSKKHTVGIITDGSATLGFGNTGAACALPVMEGKAALFKTLGDIDAFSLCLKTQDVDEIVKISTAISYSFGSINLEDINAPRCFEIEEKLIEKCNIPVFHDDQHGTAIVVLAAFLAACDALGKDYKQVKVVMSGAGAAAVAVAKLLLKAGVKNLVLSDKYGVIHKNRTENMNKYLVKMAQVTNLQNEEGTLKDVIKGADFLIGLSAGNIVDEDMVKSMNENPVVFALANPVPEIMPDIALEAGAAIVATGRSDFPNQINNSLAFPGVIKGVLEKHVKVITEDLKVACAKAIYDYTKELGISELNILPNALDKEVVARIANAIHGEV
ncbi:MAG: hypothetical protein PHX18_03395 [Candidatus Gastranaerophilales bacterium]|nr:hypothetical protein [Candidatus Gastranaerophilales bacterium]